MSDFTFAKNKFNLALADVEEDGDTFFNLALCRPELVKRP